MLRRTPMPARRKPMKKRHRDTGPDRRTRDELALRSGGWCEMRLPGCTGLATETAHRIKRGMGGRRHAETRRENNLLSNLLHSCSACHRRTHAEPDAARTLGLMLLEGQDPRQVPVTYRGSLVLRLTDDGFFVDPAVEVA